MEEIKKEIIFEQEKDQSHEMIKEIKDWIETYRKEVVIGTLSIMLMITGKKCIDLNRKNNALVYYVLNLKNKANRYMIENSELRRVLYSLAGDATRCGSSIGGQVLNAARNNKTPVIS